MLRNLFNARGNETYVTPNLFCGRYYVKHFQIYSFNFYSTLWGKGHYFHVSGHANQPQIKYLICSMQQILSINTEHLISASPWVKPGSKVGMVPTLMEYVQYILIRKMLSKYKVVSKRETKLFQKLYRGNFYLETASKLIAKEHSLVKLSLSKRPACHGV